jgi:hypothetical protein
LAHRAEESPAAPSASIHSHAGTPANKFTSDNGSTHLGRCTVPNDSVPRTPTVAVNSKLRKPSKMKPLVLAVLSSVVFATSAHAVTPSSDELALGMAALKTYDAVCSKVFRPEDKLFVDIVMGRISDSDWKEASKLVLEAHKKLGTKTFCTGTKPMMDEFIAEIRLLLK